MRYHPAYYAISFARGGRLRNELYADRSSAEASQALYDDLLRSRQTIEARFGVGSG